MKRLLILLFFLTLLGCYYVKPEKTGEEGKPIPSFKLLLTDSTTFFDTNDIPAGRPTVLFYFRPNCPFSRAQMEEMLEQISSLKNIQFYVFTDFPFQTMKHFYSQYQLMKYSNIVVGVDRTGFFLTHYNVDGVPFTAIFGKDKKLIKAYQGKIFTRQILKTLDE